MAQERKSSVTSQGGSQSLRDILTVIEKKIRNLEKRKSRLEQVEKEIEMGKEVTENQRLALLKKDQVMDMLELCRDFLQTAEALAKSDDANARAKAKREQRETNQKILDTLGNVLRLQFLLGEALRRVESEDDNLALEALRQSVDEASSKDFGKVAELWMNVLEAKPKEFAPGITYETVNQKLSSMGDLLAKLNEVSLCAENAGAAVENDQGSFCADSASSEGDLILNEAKPSAGAEVESAPGVHALHRVDGDHHQTAVTRENPAMNPTAPEVHQIHEPQLPPAGAHHPAVPAVHHHPASVLPPQPGHPVHHAAAPVPAHIPAHPGVVTLIPGMNVLSVTPAQPPMSEDAGTAIQFGSVEASVPIQPELLNGAQFGSDPGRPAGSAVAEPEGEFENREFDFFQDDLVSGPPVVASAAAPAMMLHPDPAVVHVQAGASAGPMVRHPLNAHYQQVMMHMDPQQQMQAQVHAGQQQPPHLVGKAGHDEEQRPKPVDRKADGHQMAGAHPMHPNNGQHHRQERGENRRSPRDNRGDHEGHKNAGHYRGMNGGGPGGHKGHYPDSGRNWADNRQSEKMGQNNGNRGPGRWNNRGDRPAYGNGPRHHGNGGGGYGNRNPGLMEQTAQRV